MRLGLDEVEKQRRDEGAEIRKGDGEIKQTRLEQRRWKDFYTNSKKKQVATRGLGWRGISGWPIVVSQIKSSVHESDKP